MKRRANQAAGLRPVLIISALMILLGGVTFASLQSQNAVLQGTSITSATANLQIASAANSFGAAAQGFDFTNIEPGTSLSTAKTIYFKNNGSTSLQLQVSVDPGLLTLNGIDPSQAYFMFANATGMSGSPDEESLATLMSAGSSATPHALNMAIPAGQVAQMTLQVQLASTPSNQSAATAKGINLIFSGVTVSS